MIGTSIGAAGTALAQQHLRNVLVYLDVPVLAQPEVFIHFKGELIADDGTINNDGTRKFLQDSPSTAMSRGSSTLLIEGSWKRYWPGFAPCAAGATSFVSS